jgi:PAS domain S-box-containing protein
MLKVFLSLLDNIALLVALSVIHNIIMRRWPKHAKAYQVVSGVLFGVVAVIGMAMPLQFQPGIIFDGRSIVISIAGFFGGPITGVVAAIIAASYRTWLGGAGAIMGVSVITESACIGIAYHHLRRRWPQLTAPWHLLGFGVLVHLVMLLLMLTLPGGASREVFRHVALPVITICPVATLLMCLLFLEQESRLKADTALRQSEERFRLLMQRIPVPIVVNGERNEIEYVNDRFTATFGYTRDDIPDADSWWVRAYPDEEYRREVIAAWQAATETAALEHKDIEPREYRVTCKDGTVRTVEIGGTRIGNRSMVLLNDITGRKRADEDREAFTRLAARLAASTCTEDMVKAVREESDRLLAWDAHYFAIRSQAGDDYRTLCFVDTVDGVKKEYAGAAWPVFKESPRVERVLSRETILFNRPPGSSQDVFLRFGNEDRLSASIMDVPVCSGNRVIGVLSVQSYTPYRYNQDHLRILQRIADMVAPALERAYAEDALRESEQKYRLLTEQLPDLVWQKDRNGVYVSCNKQYAKAVGVAVETIAGRRDEDFYPPELAARYRADDERVLATGQTVETEEPGEHGGELRWFSTRKVPVQDETGRCIGTIGIARDITEVKRAEKRLRESEERYRLLFTEMFEGFALHEIVTDASGSPVDYRFLEMNPAFERLTGLRAETVIGKTVREVLPAIEPRWIEVYGRVALTGKPATFENYVKELNRHYRVLAFSPTKGQFAVIFEDVTDRRQAEEALRLKNSVFDASITANSIADINGILTEANTAFLRIWGYPSKDEVLGKPIPDFLQNQNEVAAIMAALNSTGEWEGDYTARRKDGSTFAAHGLATVIRSQAGEIVGYQSAVVDLTDRQRAEEELARHRDHLEELVARRTRELEESQEKLRRSERLASIGTLAAGIGHEINNPVGGIMVTAQAALESPNLPDTVVRQLEDIVKNTQRCKDIIENVRRFARTERTEKAPADLNAVVHNAAGLIRHDLAKKGFCMEFDLADSLPRLVMNRTGMEQVVFNLIKNAIEAGAGKVTLRTEAAGDWIRLAISDDGPGVSEELATHLFDPFYTTRHATGGMGLGLSIAHAIVRDHNGAIDVASRPVEGTVFTVILPLTAST